MLKKSQSGGSIGVSNSSNAFWTGADSLGMVTSREEHLFASEMWSQQTSKNITGSHCWDPHCVAKCPKIVWNLSTTLSSWTIIFCIHEPHFDLSKISVGKFLDCDTRIQTLTSRWGSSYGIKSWLIKIRNWLAMICTNSGSLYSSGKEGRVTHSGKNWHSLFLSSEKCKVKGSLPHHQIFLCGFYKFHTYLIPEKTPNLIVEIKKIEFFHVWSSPK